MAPYLVANIRSGAPGGPQAETDGEESNGEGKRNNHFDGIHCLSSFVGSFAKLYDRRWDLFAAGHKKKEH